MLFFALALLIALLPSLLISTTSALPLPPSSLTDFDPFSPSSNEFDLAFEAHPLRQATRDEVVARLLTNADVAAGAQASPSARAVAPRASPSPGLNLSVNGNANTKRSLPKEVVLTPPAECEKALSVVDFAVVCAPITILDSASAAAFLQNGGVVRYKDNTVYRDPLYSASSGDAGSPLRAVIDAYTELPSGNDSMRALPFLTRWAMRREREGSTILALSPNTAIRIGDLKDIGLKLLGQEGFDPVKVAGVTFDWRTMQAIVDNITF